VKREIALTSVGLAAALALTGCGKSHTAAEASETATPIPANMTVIAPAGGAMVNISVTATSVTPTGGTVYLGVGKPVTFVISSTVAGQIHVHSTPEQHIVFPVGRSRVTLSFSVPGTIEVEDHALDRQIIQIQVS
jgi:hypothetical protein